MSPSARRYVPSGAGPAHPFESPDWDRANDDGTFGNRFDDPTADDGNPPQARFRTIYCATQRVATFGETLARFRPSLPLLSALEEIDDDDSKEEALSGAVDPMDPTRGLVQADWRLRRRISHAFLDPTLRFADITHLETMQHLRTALAPLATQLGITDIDVSSLMSQQRRFTQGCARYIYDQADDSGRPLFAGIRYLSRLNPDWECWAIFDKRMSHKEVSPRFPVTLLADAPDLLSVARSFRLTIEVISGHGSYIRP